MGAAENAVQRACLDYLHQRSILCWRNNALSVRGRIFVGMKGTPDIIGILDDGRFLGVEAKAPDGKLSDDQIEFAAQATRRHAVYIVAHSAAELHERLKPASVGIMALRVDR